MFEAGQTEISGVIAFLALVLASVNVVGGSRSRTGCFR